jgi:hypothetical protein
MCDDPKQNRYLASCSFVRREVNLLLSTFFFCSGVDRSFFKEEIRRRQTALSAVKIPLRLGATTPSPGAGGEERPSHSRDPSELHAAISGGSSRAAMRVTERSGGFALHNAHSSDGLCLQSDGLSVVQGETYRYGTAHAQISLNNIKSVHVPAPKDHARDGTAPASTSASGAAAAEEAKWRRWMFEVQIGALDDGQTTVAVGFDLSLPPPTATAPGSALTSPLTSGLPYTMTLPPRLVPEGGASTNPQTEPSHAPYQASGCFWQSDGVVFHHGITYQSIDHTSTQRTRQNAKSSSCRAFGQLGLDLGTATSSAVRSTRKAACFCSSKTDMWWQPLRTCPKWYTQHS